MTTLKPIPSASLALIDRLASRVRTARLTLGLPRRELSARSGVSPRYLAQLEAGEGNISILLLHRVALALNVSVEDLLTERAPLDADGTRVAQQFLEAPSQVQSHVRALLATPNQRTMRAQRVCLIGLRGAGKSTLGALAAANLDVPFVEFDDEVAAEAGMPLTEIAAIYSHDRFRDLKTQVLARVIERHDKMVLAVEGSIVEQSAAYGLLLERFHTIWVRTSPLEHVARICAQGDLRCAEGNNTAMDRLTTSLNTRTPMYERAQAQIDTTDKPIGRSVEDLLSIIAKNQFLDCGEFE